MPAFVVETGAGIANATSMCDVAFADDYISFYASDADQLAWAAQDNTTKQKRLMRGAQYLVTKYDSRWINRRVNQLQSMPWPRVCVTDSDGFAVGSDAIPVQVKQAQCEAALLDMNGTALLPDVEAAQNIASESVTAGPVQESISYVGTKSSLPVFRKIALLLKPFLTATNEVRRA
jgi:hypothetical protein